jgi:hypothetical protein
MDDAKESLSHDHIPAKESLSHDHIPVSVALSTAYAGPSRSDPPSPDGKCLGFFLNLFIC